MARADVIVVPASSPTPSRQTGQSNHIVWVSSTVRYMVFIVSDNSDIYWSKSTDGGATWTPGALIKATTCIGLAVWFDKWNPGDTGTLIHIAYMESATSDVFYQALDTADDGLDGEITVATPAGTLAASANTAITITKTEGGRIVIAYDGGAGGAGTFGCEKSDDYPPTGFTAIADVLDGSATDYYHFFPGNETDTNDFYALYWDRSAGELTLKTYDDSGNTWGESAAIGASLTSIASSTVAPQFAGATRDTDGHLLAVWWTNADNANADLMFVDITTAASIGTPVKILDSADDQAGCALAIDTANDDLYVFYLGLTAGTDTAYTSMSVNYRVSADDGATWGNETTVTVRNIPCNYITASLEFASADFCIAYGGVEPAVMALRTSYVVPSGGGGNANILHGSVVA